MHCDRLILTKCSPPSPSLLCCPFRFFLLLFFLFRLYLLLLDVVVIRLVVGRRSLIFWLFADSIIDDQRLTVQRYFYINLSLESCGQCEGVNSVDTQQQKKLKRFGWIFREEIGLRESVHSKQKIFTRIDSKRKRKVENWTFSIDWI
jgi:hypothetical protein